MHPSAMQAGKLFFDTYLRSGIQKTVVDIGAQDVNGSLRSVCPSECKYVGVDFQAAKGVDVVLADPYIFPFEDNSVDAVVSSSCFEHSEMFWVLFLEIIRILKPNGLFYLNTPSNCGFHRYPVDCYRFFPDSGNALAKWAKRNGYKTTLLEHYTCGADYVSVFLKDEAFVHQHPNRCLFATSEYSCGGLYPDFNTFVFPNNLDGKKLSHYAPQLYMPGLFE